MSKKIEKWRDIIADCNKFEMPQRDYCRRKSLSYSTFSYWRTKINKIDSPPDDENEAPFVHRTFAPMNGSAYILEWPDGMKLKMPSHLRAEDITNLVQRLRIARP